MLLSGDFHQFPPVARVHGALFDPEHSLDLSARGHELYRQFETVVLLEEQNCITDVVWMDFLNRLHTGSCTAEDIAMLDTITLESPSCRETDFDSLPWSNCTFITSRNSARHEWNTETLKRHCAQTGSVLYECPAEDYRGKDRDHLTLNERLAVAGLTDKKDKQTTRYAPVGSRYQSDGDYQHRHRIRPRDRTRGSIEDIVLDPREPTPVIADEDNVVHLLYPLALILFKPLSDSRTIPSFDNVPAGLLPIVPSEVSFLVKTSTNKYTVYRRQFVLAAAYGFTHHKGQGQTLEYVLVDLADPPKTPMDGFHAYVALSRSRGRDTVRILRDFNLDVLMTPPSPELTLEDTWLRRLHDDTLRRFHGGEFSY